MGIALALGLALAPTAPIVAALGLGVLTWSFLEYVIHRWLGHDARLRPNLFEEEHTRHHAEGNYFASGWKKAAAAAIAMAIVTPIAALVAGLTLGLAYAFGFVAFYLGYELLHRRAHTHAGFGAYGRFVRRHHFWHHFGDSRTNHGVTSPIWDFVFRTYRTPGVITIPPRLAMTWLVDPATGDVHARFADHYRLRGRKASEPASAAEPARALEPAAVGSEA